MSSPDFGVITFAKITFFGLLVLLCLLSLVGLDKPSFGLHWQMVRTPLLKARKSHPPLTNVTEVTSLVYKNMDEAYKAVAKEANRWSIQKQETLENWARLLTFSERQRYVAVGTNMSC
jgi:hypothetical protein